MFKNISLIFLSAFFLNKHYLDQYKGPNSGDLCLIFYHNITWELRLKNA